MTGPFIQRFSGCAALALSCVRTADFRGELIDDNLNALIGWTDKHNRYASREAVDLLDLEYGFMPHDSVARLRGGSQAGLKRWLKERVFGGEGLRGLVL